MKKITVAVCDDEKGIMRMVQGAIENAFELHGIDAEVDGFLSASDLSAAMKTRKYELLFLDIDMPVTDGIAFGERLRREGTTVPIIYVSNREDRVFECLTVHPFGFVRKNSFLKDISSVVEAYVDEQRVFDSDDMMILEDAEGTIYLPIARAMYIESEAKKQRIKMDTGKEYRVMRSLSIFEEKLRGFGYLRIHKGYVVNYRFIRRITDGEVTLKSGERLPISRRKAAAVKAEYMRLIQGDGSIII